MQQSQLFNQWTKLSKPQGSLVKPLSFLSFCKLPTTHRTWAYVCCLGVQQVHIGIGTGLIPCILLIHQLINSHIASGVEQSNTVFQWMVITPTTALSQLTIHTLYNVYGAVQRRHNLQSSGHGVCYYNRLLSVTDPAHECKSTTIYA